MCTPRFAGRLLWPSGEGPGPTRRVSLGSGTVALSLEIDTALFGCKGQGIPDAHRKITGITMTLSGGVTAKDRCEATLVGMFTTAETEGSEWP